MASYHPRAHQRPSWAAASDGDSDSSDSQLAVVASPPAGRGRVLPVVDASSSSSTLDGGFSIIFPSPASRLQVQQQQTPRPASRSHVFPGHDGLGNFPSPPSASAIATTRRRPSMLSRGPTETSIISLTDVSVSSIGGDDIDASWVGEDLDDEDEDEEVRLSSSSSSSAGAAIGGMSRRRRQQWSPGPLPALCPPSPTAETARTLSRVPTLLDLDLLHGSHHHRPPPLTDEMTTAAAPVSIPLDALAFVPPSSEEPASPTTASSASAALLTFEHLVSISPAALSAGIRSRYVPYDDPALSPRPTGPSLLASLFGSSLLASSTISTTTTTSSSASSSSTPKSPSKMSRKHPPQRRSRPTSSLPLNPRGILQLLLGIDDDDPLLRLCFPPPPPPARRQPEMFHALFLKDDQGDRVEEEAGEGEDGDNGGGWMFGKKALKSWMLGWIVD